MHTSLGVCVVIDWTPLSFRAGLVTHYDDRDARRPRVDGEHAR
jgi:hypothetical protein